MFFILFSEVLNTFYNTQFERERGEGITYKGNEGYT